APKGTEKIAETKIKRFIVGGEELETRLAQEIHENFDGKIEIYNEYGPTETVVGSMIYKYQPEKDKGKTVPIGTPIANTKIYVLNRHMQLQPMGVIGQVYIAGDGVARGYLNRPGLTAEKFVNLEKRPGIRTIPGHCIYKTGDLGRWHQNGSMEFFGRADSQVKIRGFRIEPGEIQNLLMENPHIKEAIVQVREGRDNSKQLCAYIVLHHRPAGKTTGEKKAGEKETEEKETGHLEGIDTAQYKEYLAQTLPDYMIPSHIIPIERIPLTPNGKLDTKKLPAPETTLQKDYIAPRTDSERTLVSIWSQLLEIPGENIGVHHNFFQMGGHSLSATILATKIHETFNIKIPLVEIFKAPTVKGLIRYIEKQEPEGKYETIEPAEKREYYQMSSAQNRLAILHRLDETGIGYNMPRVLRLEGKADVHRLEEAFKKMIVRHESLRTSFHQVDYELVQVVHHHGEIEFSIKEYPPYTTLEEKSTEAIVKNFIRPFQLEKAPLMRVALRETVEEHRTGLLLLDMHHIITDGLSMQLFIEEFAALYAGEKISPLTIQYKDFCRW
ncbi:MAG: AMP-binding protein, partial [bacterium]|nr:AMP-binding protein [bacterium]